MTSAERVQLGWGVDEQAWTRFRENVERKYGAVEPFINRELESAIEEFLDEDRYASVEELVDTLIEEIGWRPSDSIEQSPVPRRQVREREKVWTSIHSRLRESLIEYAAEHGQPKGVVLTAVLREYNAGGRVRRLTEKLEVSTNEFQEIMRDFDSVSESTLSKTERTEIRIARHLGDEFTEVELAAAIDEETSGTEYMHEKYSERVVERKSVRPWRGTNGNTIFVPEDSWNERKTTEIIQRLDVDPENPEKSISNDDLAEAIARSGIDVTDDNQDEVHEFRDRVLERLDYVPKPSSDMFGPSRRTVPRKPSE